MHKRVAQILVVTLLFAWGTPLAGAQRSAIGTGMLIHLEEILYGEAQEGALLPRLERIEEDIYGDVQSGAYLVRQQRLVTILTGAEGEVPVPMKLNAVEWAMFQRVNEGPTISKRLDQLEIAMYGEPRSNVALMERLESLLEMMWPGGKVYVSDANVPTGTLVRIELLNELNSERANPDDLIAYRVVDDVLVDNGVVIPAGAVGEGYVTSVNRSGRLGQDGLVEMNFGSIRGIDSTPVPLRMDAEATEKNKSVELAAGASIAGVVLLGPYGLAAGYFVRGKPHVVPIGSIFYVEVARDTRLQALSLVPTGR